jgi:hypothetical protein
MSKGDGYADDLPVLMEATGMAVDPAFDRARERVPTFLRDLQGCRFVPIYNGQKGPAQGVSARWDEVDGKNYGTNDATLIGFLSQGHNYGVVCGFVGLAVADIEDIARLEELGISQRISPCPTVKTGRATGLGRHFYLLCPDLKGKIILYDPVLKDSIHGGPLHLGEIQSHGCQVVGPGSVHPSGNRYELIKDLPIPTIRKEDLLKIFEGLIIEDSTSEEPPEEVRETRRRRRSGGPSLGDNIPIDAVAYPAKVKEHHGAEIIGSHPSHGSEGGKNFAINTAKNCWHCFRHKTGGGPLEWLAVEAGLIQCQDVKPGCLDKETFKKVLQIAKDRGFHMPDREPKTEKDNNKPCIQVNDQYLQDITKETLDAFVAWNNPPVIFSRAGSLVRIHQTGKRGLIIQIMDRNTLRPLVTEAADFEMIRQTKEGPEPTRVSPPHDLLDNILGLDAWPGIPEIQNIVEIPILRADGTILFKKGYDPASRLYLNPIVDLSRVAIPEKLTKQHAEVAAKYILDEILIDFPFEDNASKTNVLGAILSIIVREMIGGGIPLIVLDKPQPRTGAGLLADLISMITTGKTASIFSMPRSEAEWKKSITSALIAGSPVNIIDNVTGILRSASLNAALTSRIWTDRILGQSKMITLYQNAVWLSTGNNVQLGGEGGDLARRSMLIRIVADMARPWLRNSDNFKHPNILGWVGENHNSIVAYLLVMAAAWVEAGKPIGSCRLGSFDEWAKTISGILEYAGLTDFMGNALKMYDEMDPDTELWDAFLIQWDEINKTPISVKALTRQLTELRFEDCTPDEIAETLDKGPSMLGRVLRKHWRQTYPCGLRLDRTRDSHSKSWLWKIGRKELQIEPLPIDMRVMNKGQNEGTHNGLRVIAGGPAMPSRAGKQRGNTNDIYVDQSLTPATPASQQQETQCGDFDHPQNDSLRPKKSIKAELQAVQERTKEREEKFRTPGKLTCYKAKLRTYAITEYGMNGWVDPVKLSSAVGLPVCLVCHGLDHLKYRRYERQGGSIGYTQKVEAST